MYTTGEGPPLASRARPAFRRRAFTLVEVIVVVIIISVLLTMTAVSLSGAIGGVAARESAGGLLAALRYAHYYAAIHNCECRVTFSRADNSYDLTYRADPEQDQFDKLPGGSHAQLADRVRFTTLLIQPRDADNTNPDVITFQPTGECDGASIELSDGKATYSLVVAPSSGLVRLKKGPAGEILNDREDLDA